MNESKIKVRKEDIIIKKFTTREEILSAYPIIIQLHGHIDLKTYEVYLNDIIEDGNYQMIAAYLNNELIAVASYWILTRFYCGRYVQIGNIVVDKNYRNRGIGTLLLDYVEKEGKAKGCTKFILDSYTENKKSHKIYFRKGFFIKGFHFMKNI